jgi:hypothetical protein
MQGGKNGRPFYFGRVAVPRTFFLNLQGTAPAQFLKSALAHLMFLREAER